MREGLAYLGRGRVLTLARFPSGVERVPEDERHHTSLMDSGFLWASANLTM